VPAERRNSNNMSHTNSTTKPSSGSSSVFDALPSSTQFTLLALGVLFFFGLHNYLQEAILTVDGFSKHAVMLAYIEVLGVAVGSFLERTWRIHRYQQQHNFSAASALSRRVAPLSAYPLLMTLLMTSSALSNMSLQYVTFPTKVVFRSCKLLPTMLFASVLHQRVFALSEYVCASAICLGLILFAAADWHTSSSLSTSSSHPIGLAMLTLSVCADAVLPNAQQHLFGMGASRLEVTLYTNLLTLLVMTVTTLWSGDLLESWQHVLRSRQLQVYFGIYVIVAYVAISVHMLVVQRFGGVAAVLLATARKGMTLVLSFLLFPKGWSWCYPVGATLVLGGLLASSLLKTYSSSSQRKASAVSAGNNETDGLLLEVVTKQNNHKVLLKQHRSDIEAS
jgi:adenosine 3'-phospho 5'-phosphosulfate transporter B3